MLLSKICQSAAVLSLNVTLRSCRKRREAESSPEDEEWMDVVRVAVPVTVGFVTVLSLVGAVFLTWRYKHHLAAVCQVYGSKKRRQRTSGATPNVKETSSDTTTSPRVDRKRKRSTKHAGGPKGGKSVKWQDNQEPLADSDNKVSASTVAQRVDTCVCEADVRGAQSDHRPQQLSPQSATSFSAGESSSLTSTEEAVIRHLVVEEKSPLESKTECPVTASDDKSN